MKYLLFCLCFLFFQSLRAQKIEEIPLIREGYTTRVYSASSYVSLTSERLADKQYLFLEKADIEELNNLFASTSWMNRRTSYSLSEGLFIEVVSKDGSKYGYYFDEKGYALIKEKEYLMQLFAIPKRMQPQISEMIDRYSKLLPSRNEIVKYDHLPMSSLVLPLNKCMFNPRKKMVTIIFYIQVDSSTLVPVTYQICESRKGDIYVSRDIPLWYSLVYSGVNKEGVICAHHSGEVFSVKEKDDNQEAVEILSNLIQGWKEMSDAERMQTLDSKIVILKRILYLRKKR